MKIAILVLSVIAGLSRFTVVETYDNKAVIEDMSGFTDEVYDVDKDALVLVLQDGNVRYQAVR